MPWDDPPASRNRLQLSAAPSEGYSALRRERQQPPWLCGATHSYGPYNTCNLSPTSHHPPSPTSYLPDNTNNDKLKRPSHPASILKSLPQLLPEPSASPQDSTEPSGARNSAPADQHSQCLSRHAIADAAARATPAVVNLTLTVGRGLFLGQSSGSGSIIREDGIILTNAHVVAELVASGGGNGAAHPHTKLVVSMQDGRTFDGHVIAFDPLTDIAVVKVDSPTPLPTVKLGSARSLRPGDWVVALGNPLHLSNTVTAGIVSCVDRKSSELGLRGARSDYIQTDAAINAGNSGGPLVNLDGEVIGINNMKAMAADGVSFAIPIDTVIHVLEQLAKHGRVVRPFVGMKMLELNPAIVQQLREKDPTFPNVSAGVLVPQVVPGSPAARAGMLPGDVIVKFDSRPISSTREVIEILDDRIGARIDIEVKRSDNKSVHLQVVTEEAIPDP